MSKTRMVCPFSKQLCRECPIFRGRHMGICSLGESSGREWGARRVLETKRERDGDYAEWKEMGARGIPRSPKMLADIEDLIERREA